MDKEKLYVANLLNERLGYVRRGLHERVAEVDEILKRYAVAVPQDVETTTIEPEVERAVAPKAKRKKREV
jgi:hypothetical protein